MLNNVQYYHEIHPFIYTMKGGLKNTGELVSVWSKESKKKRVEELRKARPGILIIPTIFRWENPKEKISENIGMNGRSDIRDKHIQEILYEVETYGYDGIDIDYEGMTCNKKEKFEEFIILLSKELKKKGKLLSVAVHPKTAANHSKPMKCTGLSKPILQDFAENWRGPMTHDYKFLSRYVDRLKIMAYELHPRKYRNPGPGPQAPNVWLKAIIEYARERVPSEKLYMAIPTYGYDWALNCKSRAKAVYWDTALKIKSSQHKMYQPTNIDKILSENKNSKSWKNLTKFKYIHENKSYEDPSLWYHSNGCDRVAFFMNRKAFEEKMTLLRKYDIAGFSFWQLLSDNDPGINDYLSLLMTNKLPPVKTIAQEEEEKRLKELELEKQRLAEEQKKLEETPIENNNLKN
ncbi:MAG: hydrolase [Leptospiraceae bacterium]|nr:hydrolase [Leptospiraceae bacterium]MCP5511376.1 hydrolase [Leptospiraceae bacterium]